MIKMKPKRFRFQVSIGHACETMNPIRVWHSSLNKVKHTHWIRFHFIDLILSSRRMTWSRMKYPHGRCASLTCKSGECIHMQIFKICPPSLLPSGKFKFDEMIRNQRFFGPLFFFSFVMLMIFILMSMFLSIINAAFRKVRISNEMEENELEMVNFIMSRFLRWTGFSKRRMRKSVKARTRYIEGKRDEPTQMPKWLLKSSNIVSQSMFTILSSVSVV